MTAPVEIPLRDTDEVKFSQRELLFLEIYDFITNLVSSKLNHENSEFDAQICFP